MYIPKVLLLIKILLTLRSLLPAQHLGLQTSRSLYTTEGQRLSRLFELCSGITISKKTQWSRSLFVFFQAVQGIILRHPKDELYRPRAEYSEEGEQFRHVTCHSVAATFPHFQTPILGRTGYIKTAGRDTRQFTLIEKDFKRDKGI